MWSCSPDREPFLPGGQRVVYSPLLSCPCFVNTSPLSSEMYLRKELEGKRTQRAEKVHSLCCLGPEAHNSVVSPINSGVSSEKRKKKKATFLLQQASTLFLCPILSSFFCVHLLCLVLENGIVLDWIQRVRSSFIHA